MININNNGLGSGDNGQFTFLDIITLMGFFISIMNLNENLTQNDKQDLQQTFSDKADTLLQEIHFEYRLFYLQEQDEKIDKLLERGETQ